MEKIKVREDYTIELPIGLRGPIRPEDEFLISVAGDTIKLRKINKPNILDLAAKMKDDAKPTITEINEIVHRVRRIRR